MHDKNESGSGEYYWGVMASAEVVVALKITARVEERRDDRHLSLMWAPLASCGECSRISSRDIDDHGANVRVAHAAERNVVL